MTLAEYNLNDPPPKGTPHLILPPQPGQSTYLIKPDSIIPRSCITPSPSTAATATNSDFSFGDLSVSTNYNHSKHDLPSILRKSSITNSCSSKKEAHSWLEDFASSLEAIPGTNLRIISSAASLDELLEWYYTSRYGTSENSCENNLFPYLHGLNTSNQRSFFTDGTISSSDSPASVLPSVADDFVNLMFINSLKTSDARQNLINSIDLEDLLIPRASKLNKQHPFDLSLEIEHKENVELDIEYEPFEYVSSISYGSSPELCNRNYKDQIKLMAPLSSFVIYNYEGHDTSSLGLLIDALKNSPKIVFLVASDIEWNLINPNYFENTQAEEQSICNNEMIELMQLIKNQGSTEELHECSFPWNNSVGGKTSNNMKSSAKPSLPSDKNSKLLNYEQNLIWRLNSRKWIMEDKICLGNIIDFNNLSNNQSTDTESSPVPSNEINFKLIINCHENACFPSLGRLETIYRELKNPNSRNSAQVYYLEFPSSGSFNPEKINTLEILSFLNLLKLIFLMVEQFDHKIFVYSFDGFTGLSLLTICIEQLFKSETIEDSIVSLLSNKNHDTRLYFFKADLVFLKQFERLVNYLKHHSLFDSEFIIGLNFQDVNAFHYNYIQKVSNIKYDWFNLKNDNNFPSKVLPNLYLGSLNHANSVSILNSVKVTHLISIGECPYWVKHLKDDFIFDCKDDYEIKRARSKNIRILTPIYEFNEGYSKIYEVIFDEFPNRTKSKHVPKNLKSMVFIHNLKDDGKDSFLPLLLECPNDIQSRFLLGDSDLGSTNLGTTLIHCRIGVSRSASIILASMMKRFNMSLLSCYLYLRVQRFNIIIQPNLRLFYELYLFEEFLGLRKGMSKVYNWEILCNEIFKLNNHYI